jgi:hypothetical protein
LRSTFHPALHIFFPWLKAHSITALNNPWNPLSAYICHCASRSTSIDAKPLPRHHFSSNSTLSDFRADRITHSADIQRTILLSCNCSSSSVLRRIALKLIFDVFRILISRSSHFPADRITRSSEKRLLKIVQFLKGL